MLTLQVATLAMATAAALGSIVRIWQNERLYRWHRKVQKKKKKR